WSVAPALVGCGTARSRPSGCPATMLAPTVSPSILTAKSGMPISAASSACCLPDPRASPSSASPAAAAAGRRSPIGKGGGGVGGIPPSRAPRLRREQRQVVDGSDRQHHTHAEDKQRRQDLHAHHPDTVEPLHNPLANLCSDDADHDQRGGKAEAEHDDRR